jgi:hypothetical protein
VGLLRSSPTDQVGAPHARILTEATKRPFARISDESTRLALIRDIDNPFEYRGGLPGPADVDFGVLERGEARLRSLAMTIRSA